MRCSPASGKGGRGSCWYEHRPVLVDRQGEIHPMGDFRKHRECHEAAAAAGRELAEVLGIEFHVGGDEEFLVIEGVVGAPEIRFGPDEKEAPPRPPPLVTPQPLPETPER